LLVESNPEPSRDTTNVTSVLYFYYIEVLTHHNDFLEIFCITDQ
jgi:hypothetical protein